MRKLNDRLDTKVKLKAWIEKDRVSSGYSAKFSFRERIIDFFAPNYILTRYRLEGQSFFFILEF